MDALRKDLIILVADADAKRSIETLLEKRPVDLGIRRISSVVYPHYGHDPWVYRHGHEFLRDQQRMYSHAMVVFDFEGSGGETNSADQLEQEVELDLRRSGWAEGTAAAVVISPELEAWLWGPDQTLCEVLEIDEAALGAVLSKFALGTSGKVERPKEAFEAVLRRLSRPRSSAIFEELAETQECFDECHDRAFCKFRDKLREWFPPQGVG